MRSLYQTKNRVKIVPWNQINAVHIDEIYTDLSWVMDHRTPRGVTKEELNHYTKIFVRREPHPAPKRILVYGQPGNSIVNYRRVKMYDSNVKANKLVALTQLYNTHTHTHKNKNTPLPLVILSQKIDALKVKVEEVQRCATRWILSFNPGEMPDGERLLALYPGGVLPYITCTGMCRPTGS